MRIDIYSSTIEITPIQIFQSRKIFITLLTVLVICITGSISTAQHIETIKFDSVVYQSLLQSINKHHITFLDSPWQLVTADDSVRQDVIVPKISSKNSQAHYFKNSFTIPDSLKNNDLRIWFLGIEGLSVIKCNGNILKSHINSTSSFSIDMPRHLLQTERANELEIHIRKPSKNSEGIPKFVNLFRQAEYLSLLREVYLEWIPNITFSNLKYQFADEQLHFSYHLQIRKINSQEYIGQRVRIEEAIYSSDGKRIHNRYEYIPYENVDKAFERTVQINNVQYWEPATPNLYRLQLTLFTPSGLQAIYNRKIGLRNINIQAGTILLNKKPIKIKGIVYREVYETSILNNSIAEFYTQLKRDFETIKALGFNTVRFPNAVPHPYTAWLADSLGLFLFIENGIWRVPENFFVSDKFLQNAKNTATEILQTFHLHPSFFALGLGQEIPIHVASVQKFILIIKEYLKQNYQVLTYISPINERYILPENVTDFYLYNKYDQKLISDFEKLATIIRSNASLPFILGNIGFAAPVRGIDNIINGEERQERLTRKALSLVNNVENLDGIFIESFRDWQAEVSSTITIKTSSRKYVHPFGILSHSGEHRKLYNTISDMLNRGNMQAVDVINGVKKTNFFSLTIFISFIVVVLIYRRNFRLRENIKRAFAHPYGFYVDLRDRRIISIFNSTLMGLFTNLIVANIIAAFCYFYYDNLLFEEYFSALIHPLGIKTLYLAVFSSPPLLLLWIWLSFYFLQLLIVVLLKILNFFSRDRLRFRQILAICNWAGLPLILLTPVSLLSFHLLQQGNLQIYTIILMCFFFFWYNYRLANGMRVLLISRSYKVFTIMILTYCIVLSIFVAFFDARYDILSYYKLLSEAKNLF